MVKGRVIASGASDRRGGGYRRWGWRQQGYTYTESLVVIGVLSIMALTATPIFSEVMENYRVRAATTRMYSQLQWARQQAVTENTDVRVRQDLSGAVGVERKTASGWQVVPFGVVSASGGGGLGETPDVVVNLSGEIVFSASGRAKTAGTATVTGYYGTTRQVAVSPGGRIKVQ